MQSRWSLASRLLDGTCTAATIDPPTVLAALAGTGARDVGRALDQLLTGGSMTATDRAALDAHAAPLGSLDWPEVAELVALAASAPSYQWS